MHKVQTEVHVFKDAKGEWRWKALDFNNKKEVANSGEGYVHMGWAIKQAVKRNNVKQEDIIIDDTTLRKPAEESGPSA